MCISYYTRIFMITHGFSLAIPYYASNTNEARDFNTYA